MWDKTERFSLPIRGGEEVRVERRGLVVQILIIFVLALTAHVLEMFIWRSSRFEIPKRLARFRTQRWNRVMV